MSKKGQAEEQAVDWLRERGGDAAVAKTAAGGRIILAQGETAPFMMGTFKKLEKAGKIEYYDPSGGTKRSRMRLCATN